MVDKRQNSYRPPVWDDLRFSASSAKQGQVDKPAFDFTNIGLTFPANDETHIIYINAQMPHSWKEDTAIKPHVHIAQTSAAVPKFVMVYRWYPIGELIPSFSDPIESNGGVKAYVSGTLHQLLSFGEIQPPNISVVGVSTMLDIKIYRKTGDGAAATVLLKEFDIHFQKDAGGSNLEHIK